jgi:hypothetical protein
MYKRNIFVVMSLFALMAAACAPIFATPSPVVTEEPGIPVTGVAVVQSVDIQILESQPLQLNAILRGQLPDAGCTTIASIDQTHSGNIMELTIGTTTDLLALCAQALTPFERVVPLDVSDLPAGRYIVRVGGIEQSFDLPAGDAAHFKQSLLDALNARDYARLKELMGDSFMIGYWQSEGTSNTAEAAIEQLQLNLLNSSTPITADPNKDLVALLGADPVAIVGPDVIEASPLFTSGWGVEGKDEAILFTAERPDVSPYWYGLLFAKDGFAMLIPDAGSNPPAMPLPGEQPTPEREPVPTISILDVVKDSSVTIRTYDYPANVDFKVRMGFIGTKGIDGFVVDTVNSRKGGSFTVTFEIPERLHGEKQIAIRLESQEGYYSYNWFDNASSWSMQISTDPLPTNVKYVIARKDVSIYSGPSKNYSILGSIAEDQTAQVTGVSLDGRWWQVVCPGNSVGNCWVSANPSLTRPTQAPS